ncbi:hypothetical protein ACVWY0_003688 [Arthrobacter sp. UYNi723]
MPISKRRLSPLIRTYLNFSRSAQAEARGPGELKPVEPAARPDGAPLLGDDQVYIMKYGTDYHPAWCQVTANSWDHAPRRLFVTPLAAVGERTRCTECDRHAKAARASAAQEHHVRALPTTEPAPPDAVIPLKVMGLAHGILFLAAEQEYRERLQETAVERATPLYVNGRRDGMVVRLDCSRDEPLVVVQMDPRATFRNGPYQVRLRHPLRRAATKPYAVESVESVEPAL